MNNKLLSVLLIIILSAGIFTVFATVVYAKSSGLLCSKKQKMTVTLKNDANIDKAKVKILEIQKVKIINIKDRNQEWSRMVNKMDLPKMENPFKNEFVIKINKNANTDEIYGKIKELDFVENVEYISDTECKGK